MTPDRYAAALLEDIPDGTYGQAKPIRGWTKAEQDQHYADLCEDRGVVNDRAVKPNHRRKKRSN